MSTHASGYGVAVDVDAVAAALACTGIFGRLPAPTLRRVAAVCTTRSYRRDQFIWYQGDPGDYLIVVTNGLVKIVVTSPEGDEMVLAASGPFDVIGELSVVDQGTRSASVVAIRPTDVVLLGRPALITLMQQNPELIDDVMRSLGALVRKLTDQASDLVFLDLSGRVAKLLLRQASTATPGPGPRTIDLPLNQTEMAQMVGSTRPALNKALQTLVSRGLIVLQGRSVTILDPAGLRQRAGL